MRFLCDEMLARLGRWLRAAGHDTVVAEGGTTDGALLAQARREGRRLLTRDRKLLEHRDAAEDVTVLTAHRVAEQAAEAASRLGVDWQAAPFTRCLICNTPLQAAGPDALARVPPRARAIPGPVRHCPECGRVYWQGSHHRRMRRVLAKFAGRS